MSVSSSTAALLVVAPADPIELRHSINSVLRAATYADSSVAAVDIIVFDEARVYSDSYIFDNLRIPIVRSGTALQRLQHDYLFIVPALTLISQTWIVDALQHFAHHAPQLLRPEIHVTWGAGETRIWRQPEALPAPYSLLGPAYSGAVALPQPLFRRQLKAAPSDLSVAQWLSEGIGWLDMPSDTIPNTVAFTRGQTAPVYVPYPHLPPFDFAATRQAATPPLATSPILPLGASARSLRSRIPARRLAVGALRRTRLLTPAKRALKASGLVHPTQQRFLLPQWIVDEWRALHRIDNRTFPIANLPITDALTSLTQQAASLYTAVARQLHGSHYDYIFFAPWLIRGGADKFTIDYANTIAKLRPDLNILVLTTLDREAEWASKLAPTVDYCNFGSLTADVSQPLQLALLAALVAQSGAKTLHIINSELAYDFVHHYKPWLSSQAIRVIATAFSQEISPEGKVLGYSHSHLPAIYDATTLITSDNQAVTTMWQDDYGFDPAKLLVHHLAHVKPAIDTTSSVRTGSPRVTFRVLWASRLSIEKLPELVSEIGRQLIDDGITIDMYGAVTTGFDTSFLRQLPANVHYKGAFNGMATLPLRKYDAFLYTSLFDGMPNTLLEIGLEGLPIVASAIGGIPELIEDRVTGLLVQDSHQAAPYADALRQLKASPDLGRQLSSTLRQRVERDYSVEQFERAVSAMLERLGY